MSQMAQEVASEGQATRRHQGLEPTKLEVEGIVGYIKRNLDNGCRETVHFDGFRVEGARAMN